MSVNLMKRSGIKQFVLLGVISGISLLAYILYSQWIYRIGFPLDDAWIHQTYARNLALEGSWSYVKGVPSGGSTAPGWSLLLSLGYLLRLDKYLWTFLWGWIALWGISVVATLGFKQLLPARPGWALLAGIGLALEWHLVWAAGSGMETILFALLALVFLVALVTIDQASALKKHWEALIWIGMGALIGSCVWIRPDGITLIGAIAFVLLFKRWKKRKKLAITALLAAGFSGFFIPYVLLTRSLSGEWWPNTFYAKQAEYAVLRDFPLWERVLSEWSLLIVGAGVIILPGFIWITMRSIRERRWGEAASALWVVGFVALYAWRLPVVYQHGRYIFPVIPVFFVWGMAGMGDLVLKAKANHSWQILSKAWVISAAVLMISFWLLGAKAYATDVAIIESEIVEAARWIAENTGSGSIVAAHDIGGLGYFGRREIIDLAGLVSPEVIPFIRDEIALTNFLNEKNVEYLMTFPGWYPILSAKAASVYISEGKFSLAVGGENIQIYRWKSDK